MKECDTEYNVGSRLLLTTICTCRSESLMHKVMCFAKHCTKHIPFRNLLLSNQSAVAASFALSTCTAASATQSRSLA